MNTAEIRAMLDEVAPDPDDREAVEHHNNLVRVALDTAPEVQQEVEKQVEFRMLLELFTATLERPLTQTEQEVVAQQLQMQDASVLVRVPVRSSAAELEAWLEEGQAD